VYDEEIVKTSNRLAPKGFFTDRPEFPKIAVNSLGSQRVKIVDKFIDYNFFKPINNEKDFKQFAYSDSSYCSESEEKHLS
jgi:hypothetical protein